MATSNYRETDPRILDYTTPTHQDASHLAGDLGTSLVGGSSMSAGNTTSRPHPAPIAGAPGSEPVNPPSAGVVNDNPGVDVGDQTSHTHRVR